MQGPLVIFMIMNHGNAFHKVILKHGSLRCTCNLKKNGTKITALYQEKNNALENENT